MVRAALLVLAGLSAQAFAGSGSLAVGLGKALNNTNVALPGYSGTARIGIVSGRWMYSAAYTRIGASYLAEDAAISTLGASFTPTRGRYSYGMSLITGASYSAAVWWDATKPQQACGVMGCGRRYDNDGVHFSRACHLCGGTMFISYRLTSRLNLRAEYYGLRHMTPTFQGTIVSVEYALYGS